MSTAELVAVLRRFSLQLTGICSRVFTPPNVPSRNESIVSEEPETPGGVGRWERGETPLDPAAETIIRMIVLEWADQRQSVEEVSKRAVPGADAWQITIDAHDPSDYRKLAA